MASRIEYSEKYTDDSFEYRHVILPKETAKNLPKARLLSETEWRGIGVQQSRGWQHYAIHRSENSSRLLLPPCDVWLAPHSPSGIDIPFCVF
jgi:cyclin-dependent kinase regulatory subunit CKS1